MRLTDIKGVGEKTEKLFHKLGIYDVKGLLQHYPRSYNIYEQPITLDEADNRAVISVRGVVVRTGRVVNTGRFKIYGMDISDAAGNMIRATWFNMPYLKNVFHAGDEYIFRGRIKREGGSVTFEHPEYFTPEAYMLKQNSLQPVYGTVAGLSNSVILKTIKRILEDEDNLEENELGDRLPQSLISRYNLKDYAYAIKNIHFPTNYAELKSARERLVFDEFFLFIYLLNAGKEKNRTDSPYIIKGGTAVFDIAEKLPYRLTEAQKKALKEILDDMASGKSMNRLVQGDVGSGKTIVAFLAMIQTAISGFTAAIMAPTEVLAKQHYQNMCAMAEDYNLPVKACLLTGSVGAAEKKRLKTLIKNGEINIIIGTSALIQENVEYSKLALVVTDEQHRFGVDQRKAFADKGPDPHILVMSATPIPRTLSIILYGNLNLSVIDEMPADRLPIKNCVVGKEYRKKAYHFIENEIKKGRQAYIICPMIEENEMFDVEDAITYAEVIRKNMSPGIKTACLHGNMSSREKNGIMESFAKGDTDILVSTTVVEVGVNVPNATVMMIENAERFGLSTLHQLRGRVGRGKEQSYCIFVRTTDNVNVVEKLDIVGKSNDGFYIASQDLKLRGPGDMSGVRQSGRFDFEIGDIYADADILKMAKEAADYADAEGIRINPEDIDNKIKF